MPHWALALVLFVMKYFDYKLIWNYLTVSIVHTYINLARNLNFSTKYFIPSKVYTDGGGIK